MTVDEEKAVFVEEAIQEAKQPRTRTLLLILGVLCLTLLLASAIMAWKLLYTPTQQQAQAGTDLAAQVQAACADPRQDTKTLKNLCNDADDVVDERPATVEGPPGDTGPQGDQGVAGAEGPPPSDVQVQRAVASYCAAQGCRGAKGDSVTQAQVATAVASYCNSNGQCRGPAGATGSAGQDGAEGDQGERGEQGSGPTDAQVASAVATYCSSRNNCQGDQGPKGETGDTGATGQDGQPGDTVDGGSCAFTGIGTLTITIQTSTGPTTFECVGSPLEGGTQ